MPSFEELKALAAVVRKNKINTKCLFSRGTLYAKLYQGIEDQHFQTEADAIRVLYLGKASPSSFHKLKSRLYDRLKASLFSVDTHPDFASQLHKAYYECVRDFSAARILLGNHARQAAIPLTERVLKIAEKYEFTDIVLEAAKILRQHYGGMTGDIKRFNRYDKLVDTYAGIYALEVKVEGYYTSLMSNFARSNATKPELQAVAEQYCRELEPFLKEGYSYRLNLHGFLIRIIRHEIVNDHENVVAACDRALAFFAKKRHIASNTAMFNFLIRKMPSLIILGRFDEAEKTGRRCADLAVEGFNNWFIALYFLMILYFHSNQFSKAYSTFRKGVQHPLLSAQYPNTLETWKILEALIHYFILTGRITSRNRGGIPAFRLNKFLNEVPTYSKDKRGTNITILIIQVLFLLQNQKYEQIVDRTDALRAYVSRYLRRNDTFRSHCFINMLLLLPKNSFHRAAVLRKAEPYRKKLHSVPLGLANQTIEIEIVPYETLWQCVLDSLDDQFH